MGFSWTENIGVGASIDAADIQEIRTNVDTVDDEKCAADKVSYDNDDKDGDDGTHNPGYLNNDNGTYYNGDYGTERSSEYGTYQSGWQNGVRATWDCPGFD